MKVKPKTMDEYECDWCRTRGRAPEGYLPPGWERVRVHGCGLTGYTAEAEVCHKCFVKRGKKHDF